MERRSSSETERIENLPDDWGARETYKIVSPDEYNEVFELAPPQKSSQYMPKAVGSA
jgi:hypothetical protein